MNQEAQRCILCKKPRCSAACPVSTHVPEAMLLYREGRLEEAGELLFLNNPLSAITSLVCNWGIFCNGNCVLNVKGEPVRWYEIEQEVSCKFIMEHGLKRTGKDLEGKKIAIAGAGPAGITAAVFLWREGAEIEIFDPNPEIGGVLLYGIPDFRLNRTLVRRYGTILAEAGILFHPGKAVGKDIPIDYLSSSYDAVIVATGAEVPSKLGIPGEERAVQALEFLRNPPGFPLGEKVIVIGGGNVAIDAARTAKRMRDDVAVYYRKGRTNMPANPSETEAAVNEGVRFEYFWAPVGFDGNNAVFAPCENITDPTTGAILTRILEGDPEIVPCDTLILAIGEKPDKSITAMCQAPNLFPAGDYAYGPKTVVEAVASARSVSRDIISFLSGR